MTAGAGARAARSMGSFIARGLLVLGIGSLVVIGMLVAYPPISLIKDQLARDLGAALGREVTIADAKLEVDFPPVLEAEITGLAIANPAGMPAGHVLRARAATADVELLPLLKGRVVIKRLNIIEPNVTLEEGSDGQRNWVFTFANSKGPAMPTPPSLSIEEGKISFTSARTGASRYVEDVNAVVSHDGVTGAATIEGTLSAKRELVTYTATLADSYAALEGRNSDLKLTLDSRLMKVDLTGDALFAAAAEFAGDVDAATPSLAELASWLGIQTAGTSEPAKASLAGKLKATTRDITFAKTDIRVGGTSANLDGRLDLAGPRPRLEGTLAAERIDLSRLKSSPARAGLAPDASSAPGEEIEIAPGWDQLLDDLQALEQPGTGPAPAAPGAAAAPEVAARSTWSEEPFDLTSLRTLDADLMITAGEIAFGTLDMRQGRIKATIQDGIFAAKVEELRLGGGRATGTVDVDSRAAPPKAALALALTDVAAEPLIAELTGKPLLSGTSNVEITAKAAGQTQSQLASTLEGKARFRMGQGALRGFDVRRMISEWWRKWRFDLAMKTGFEKLEASYDIKKGVLSSEPGLALGGPEVEISSTGNVNVPARLLDQDLRIKVVPPPTALPIPVRIKGPWTTPSIGIDWGSLLASASPELDGPHAVAPSAEPVPPDVEAAIRRVLDAPPETLTESGKALLRALVPAAP